MSIISKASIATLRRRADAIFAMLAEGHPTQVQELKLLLEVIRQRENSTGNDFAGIRSPRRAIEFCLTERGTPMSKQQILDRLIAGGYCSEADKWLVNDNMNLNVRKGYLVAGPEIPDDRMAMMISLPTPEPK